MHRRRISPPTQPGEHAAACSAFVRQSSLLRQNSSARNDFSLRAECALNLSSNQSVRDRGEHTDRARGFRHAELLQLACSRSALSVGFALASDTLAEAAHANQAKECAVQARTRAVTVYGAGQLALTRVALVTNVVVLNGTFGIGGAHVARHTEVTLGRVALLTRGAFDVLAALAIALLVTRPTRALVGGARVSAARVSDHLAFALGVGGATRGDGRASARLRVGVASEPSQAVEARESRTTVGNVGANGRVTLRVVHATISVRVTRPNFRRLLVVTAVRSLLEAQQLLVRISWGRAIDGARGDLVLDIRT